MNQYRIKRISAAGRPEGDEEGVVLACTQLLQLNGARVHRVVERIPWGKRKSEAGIPDLFGWFSPPGIGMAKGKPVHFYLEVKAPGKKLRKAQVDWITLALADNVIVLWADSVEAMVTNFGNFGIYLRGLS